MTSQPTAASTPLRAGRAGPKTAAKAVEVALLAAFLVFIGLVLFRWAMEQPYSHDENQFVASGWFLARQGLLPYRDFPYHHMPYQIALDAVAFLLTPYLLLAARVLNWLAAWLSALILLLIGRSLLVNRGQLLRFCLPVLAVLALVTNPIVVYTTGQAWNHDWPSLLALAALGLHLGSLTTDGRHGRAAAVGVLIGLSTGIRLSYAVLVPVFFLSYLAISGAWVARLRQGTFMLLGVALAGLPATILLGIDPKAFVYGNILYPILNGEYRVVLRHWSGDAWLAKLSFFGETVLSQPGNVVLILGVILLGGWAMARAGGPRDKRHALAVALGAAGALFLSAFAPTPAWYQYFYAVVPFAVVSLVLAVAALPQGTWELRAGAGFFTATVLGGLVISLPSGVLSPRLQPPEEWLPVKVHRIGQELQRQVGRGMVLTLAPILPMEGGLSPYPAFAAGPFTWRVADYIPAENRRRVGWVGPRDLEQYLAEDPPAAILTGLERSNEGFEPGQAGNIELPLDDYAEAHGYRDTVLQAPLFSGTVRLWLRPAD